MFVFASIRAGSKKARTINTNNMSYRLFNFWTTDDENFLISSE